MTKARSDNNRDYIPRQNNICIIHGWSPVGYMDKKPYPMPDLVLGPLPTAISLYYPFIDICIFPWLFFI